MTDLLKQFYKLVEFIHSLNILYNNRFFQTVNEENVSYLKYFESAVIVLNFFTKIYVSRCKIKPTKFTFKHF